MCNLLISGFCGKFAETVDLGEKEKFLEIPGGWGVFKDPLERKFQGGRGGSKVKNLPWGVWIFSGIAQCDFKMEIENVKICCNFGSPLDHDLVFSLVGSFWNSDID